MKRESNEESLGAVIKRLINSPNWKNKVTQHRIMNDWQSLMGDSIAKRTQNIYYKDGVLQITFNSASLKQEIFYSKDLLSQKLNEILGEGVVEEIIVK